MKAPSRRVRLDPDDPPDRPVPAAGNTLQGLTPSAAISEGGLLHGAFSGPTWSRWHAVLKAAYGEQLTPEELALFKEVAGDREPPKRQVSELWVIAGRRSGKDSIGSACAAVAALGDFSNVLRPGERASILCLASDRAQAKIIFRYIKGYFTSISSLQPLLIRDTENVLELTNGVEIIVSTSSYKAVRGRAICCCVLDECGFFSGSDDSPQNAEEVYNALAPSLATIPGSILIGISSPHRAAGLLHSRWKDAFGKSDPDTLVIQGATRQFNPLIPQRIVDKAMEQDEEVARSEWLGCWRRDLSSYVDREVLEKCTMQGIGVIPPIPGAEYKGFIDSAGGSGSDSYTMAIGFIENGICTLARIEEAKPPFSPEVVTEQFCAILHEYGITSIVSDRYAAGFSKEAFARYGVSCVQAAAPKSQLYAETLPLLNSGKVQILDHAKLLNQLASLERRVSRSGTGREVIDAPPGGHEDLANSCAGVITLLANDQRPALIARSSMLIRNIAPPWPGIADVAYGVFMPSKDGSCACAFIAKLPGESKIILLDFMAEPQSGSSITDAIEFSKNLRTQMRVRYAIEFFLPENLLIPVQQLGYEFARPIPDGLLTDPAATALNAAAHVARGSVLISDIADQHAKTHPLGGALSIRAGEIADNPLRTALLIAINLGLTRSH